MVSGDLQAVTARLDIFRDILIELATALPPDRVAGVATAIGNRMTERLGDAEIDEHTDVAMVSDLAPLFVVNRGPAPPASSAVIDLTAFRSGRVANSSAPGP